MVEARLQIYVHLQGLIYTKKQVQSVSYPRAQQI